MFIARESVRWAGRAEKILQSEGERAAAAYAIGGEAAALAAVNEDAWKVYIDALWLAIAPAGAALVAEWIPKAAYDPYVAAVLRYLHQYGAKRSRQLSATSRKKLSDLIQMFVERHEARETAAAKIREDWLATAKTRARVIARTEVHAAANFGSITAAEESQVSLVKIWTHVSDRRVRDTHIAAEGQRRGLREPFDIGGYQLQFPGDGSMGAPGAIVINCRCAMRYERVARPAPVHPIRRPRAA